MYDVRSDFTTNQSNRTFERAGEGVEIEEIAPRAEVRVGIAKFGAELLEERIERRGEELESHAEAFVKRLEDGDRKSHLLRRTVRSEECLISAA